MSISNSVSNNIRQGVYENNLNNLIKSINKKDIETYTIYGEGERSLQTNDIIFSMGQGAIITDNFGIPIPISNLEIKKINIILDVSLNDSFEIGNKTTKFKFEVDNDILQVTTTGITFVSKYIDRNIEITLVDDFKLNDDDLYITSKYIGNVVRDVRVRFSILLKKDDTFINNTDTIFSDINIKRN